MKVNISSQGRGNPYDGLFFFWFTRNSAVSHDYYINIAPQLRRPGVRVRVTEAQGVNCPSCQQDCRTLEASDKKDQEVASQLLVAACDAAL